MITAFLGHPLVVSLLVFGASVGLLYVTSRLAGVVPRDSALEGWALRWTAAIQAIIVLAAAVWIVNVLYPSDPQARRWLTVLVVVVVAWSARHALSDLWSGLVLRGEGTLRAGARIGWTEGKGRIVRLGLVAVELEAEDGQRLRVPYSTLAGQAILSSPTGPVARSHSFLIQTAAAGDASQQEQALTSAAVLSAWSAAEPSPSVRLVDQTERERRFEVTVYPIGQADGLKVEAAVRAAAHGENPGPGLDVARG